MFNNLVGRAGGRRAHRILFKKKGELDATLFDDAAGLPLP
jgi:hypothetical protein